MRVVVLEKRFIEVRKVALDRIEKASREGLCVACLNPTGGRRVTRGLCLRCYHATLRAIQSGATTEKDRVAAGKLLERGKAGRKPSNAVSIDVAS